MPMLFSKKEDMVFTTIRVGLVSEPLFFNACAIRFSPSGDSIAS